jgi:hypothetical protein
MVHRFRLTARSVAILQQAATSPYDWQAPHLPEDPAFLREDGSTWLGTITHEHDVFLELSPQEKEALLEAMPNLHIRRDDHTILGIARLGPQNLSAEQVRAHEEQYLEPPAEVRMAQFADEPGYWLLRLDRYGNRLADTCHESLHAALDHARREFALTPADWQLAGGADRPSS